MRTKGEEKKRRSGGEIECLPLWIEGKEVLSLGDGSFQVHFSFVATAGIVFFRMGEFAAWHLQNCV